MCVVGMTHLQHISDNVILTIKLSNQCNRLIYEEGFVFRAILVLLSKTSCYDLFSD